MKQPWNSGGTGRLIKFQFRLSKLSRRRKIVDTSQASPGLCPDVCTKRLLLSIAQLSSRINRRIFLFKSLKQRQNGSALLSQIEWKDSSIGNQDWAESSELRLSRIRWIPIDASPVTI